MMAQKSYILSRNHTLNFEFSLSQVRDTDSPILCSCVQKHGFTVHISHETWDTTDTLSALHCQCSSVHIFSTLYEAV